MEYKATFRSMAGLTFVLLFMASLCLAIGIHAHAFGMIPVGLLLIILLVVIRFRFKVVIGDDDISATGFFKTRRLRIANVTEAKWMSEYGYSRNRFYSPFVYEIRSPEETLRINFKLFPIECMDTILKMIEERTTTFRLSGTSGVFPQSEA